MSMYLTQFSCNKGESCDCDPNSQESKLNCFLDESGVKIHHVYFEPSDHEGVLIFDAPDDLVAVEVVNSASAAGCFISHRTTPVGSFGVDNYSDSVRTPLRAPLKPAARTPTDKVLAERHAPSW